MTIFFTFVALGSISLCFADQSDGSIQKAVATALTPTLKHNEMLNHAPIPKTIQKIPCTCGVFLSSQFTKGSGKQPNGYAALMHEHDDPASCNALGVKTCTNRCLEIVAKHLPNSPAIICGSIDRDVYKERAHLFVKNCNDSWINTLLSTGKEYCCKDGHQYKCPKF